MNFFSTNKLLFLISLLFTQINFAEQIAEDELLPPNEAFKASVKTIDNKNLEITYKIADKYYLYNSKFKFQSKNEDVKLGKAIIPEGKKKVDSFFGEVQIHRNQVSIKLPYENSNKISEFELVSTAQGCADIGVCYPPYSTNLSVELPQTSIVDNVKKQTSEALQTASNALKSLSRDFGLEEENEVLHPDEAFKAQVISNEGEIIVKVKIEDLHYLYQNKFKFSLKDADDFKLGKPKFSPSEEKEDPFFGKVQVYHHLAEISLPVTSNKGSVLDGVLLVTYQGCSEATGICYPPQNKSFPVKLKTAITPSSKTPLNKPDEMTPVTEQDKLAATLSSDNVILTLLTFFGLGLLLSFTPCVFPMIPILSSIIVGHGDKITTGRAFRLSLAYVLAMAFTYTAAGIIVGMMSVNVQIWFQDPIVLSIFAAVFVALSFSMFGFYELQMPASIQAKLTNISNEQKGGSLKGAAIMGFLSALIVGPCVTAPLVGALIYIAETGDAVFGGLALFSLSMGMGAPLIMIGTSAGKILPKAGAWMDTTKAIFGVMLLAMAIWMLERVIPVQATMALAAVLLIGSGIYSGAFEAIGEKSGWFKLWKTFGVILLIYGSTLMIGALSGGNSFFTPLKGSFSGTGVAIEKTHLTFENIKGIEGLKKALAKAQSENRNVMLDFYADWCISCKEMEAYTFSDKRVKTALGNALLIKADVTANDEKDQALLKHFGLFGPPGIIFYNTSSPEEQKNYRVVGYMEAESFADNIKKAFK